MCNKQNYSFKKVYIITFIITVVSFIVFFLYAISHGSVTKYDKQQNTSTILEMINYSSIGEVSIIFKIIAYNRILVLHTYHDIF